MKHNSNELLEIVKNELEDLKAQDISVLNVTKMTAMADFMVVATGTSKQHVNSLATNLLAKMKAHGMKGGNQTDSIGEWALVDLGDVIVHIMQEETRQFYSLEKIWSTFEESKTG